MSWTPLTDDNCSSIFEANTTELLGNKAICTWSTDESSNVNGTQTLLTVNLTSTSKVGIHSALYIRKDVLNYLSAMKPTNNEEITLVGLTWPLNPIYPAINLHIPSTIGICDNLVLDATKTLHLGGRQALFQWDVTTYYPSTKNQSTQVTGVIMILDKDDGSIYEITLNVTTWYEFSQVQQMVVKRLDSAVPFLTFYGHNYFTKDLWTNKNDKSALQFVPIVALPSLNLSCLNPSIEPSIYFSALQYVWNVTIQNTQEGDVESLDSWNTLLDYLEDRKNTTSLLLDVDDMLERGITYNFSLTVTCPANICGSQVRSTDYYTFTYEFSTIQCQIKGGDHMTVYGTVSALHAYRLTLDASTFSFNPDFIDTDSHLFTANWTCTQSTGPCNDLILSSNTNTSVNISLISGHHPGQSNYSYLFTLTVQNDEFQSCVDTIGIDVFVTDEDGNNNGNSNKSTTTKPTTATTTTTTTTTTATLTPTTTTTPTAIPTATPTIQKVGALNMIDNSDSDIVIVFVTSLHAHVNWDDKIRIVGQVLIYNKNVEYEYQWIEANNLLTSDNLQQCKQSVSNEQNVTVAGTAILNLVLYCPQHLVPGLVYRFELQVWERSSNTLRGNGYVDITINRSPRVIESSLQTYPSCVSGANQPIMLLSSLRDSWNATHAFSLQVFAEEDNANELIYVFQLIVNSYSYYLHVDPYSNVNNLLSGVLLPAITSPNIRVSLFDPISGSSSTHTLQCDTLFQLQDGYNLCSDDWTVVNRSIHYNYDRNALFQSLLNVLLYVDETFDDDTISQCGSNVLAFVIDSLYRYVSSRSISAYCSIALFQFEIPSIAQIFDLHNRLIVQWKDVLVPTTVVDMTQWQYLLTVIYDPCRFLPTITDVNHLWTNPSSIITQRTSVYYSSNEVSSSLSPLFRSLMFRDLLWQSIDSSLELLRSFPTRSDLWFLLVNTTYVGQVLDTSLFVPAEFNAYPELQNIAMYSFRVHDPNGESTASLQTASVYVPGTIVKSSSRKGGFASIDALMLEIPNVQDDSADSDKQLIASSVQVHLTPMNDSTRHKLPTNVEIAFSGVAKGKSGTIICVSTIDGVQSEWRSDGCETTVDADSGNVLCNCSHVTTFSVVKEVSSNSRASVIDEFSRANFQSIHVCFGVIFASVLAYTSWKLIPLIVGHVLQHQVMTAGLINTCLIPVYSCLQLLLCLILLVIPYSASNLSYDALAGLLVIVAMLCIFLSFVMLCGVLHSWVSISNPMGRSAVGIPIMLKKIFTAAAVFATVLVIAQIILYFLHVTFFYLFETIFTIAVFLASILFALFGFKMYRVVTQTIQHQANSRSAMRTGNSAPKSNKDEEDRKLVFRIRLLIVVVVFYSLVQMCLSIYSQTIHKFSFAVRFVDLLSNAVLLCAFVVAYRPQIQRMQLELHLADQRLFIFFQQQ
ncbi:hypothetical protein RFI_10795 [Reticulomyxa filosa]|uniref:Uncharacterized protein n=1 Tax=Reticulomyxa filosa TaxID=46433 RepID=X6NKU1_RETFI|nr:hypothetical protein RFI_10795 [Reticulomyxa filosa]|eukprot:ETO26344.1 hypothetical protein RFI_10795 [Reticulomyxa filosa]